jgi:hypothetical protein
MYHILRLSFIFGILLLTACSPASIKTAEGVKVGDYRVVEISIEPSQEMLAEKTRGSVQDAQEFEQILRPELSRVLSTHVAGKPVAMAITVDEINLHMNAPLAIVWTDTIQVLTTVKLLDIETKREIGSIPIMTISKASTGLLGLAIDAMSSDTSESIKMDLAQKFSVRVEQAIYPE